MAKKKKKLLLFCEQEEKYFASIKDGTMDDGKKYTDVQITNHPDFALNAIKMNWIQRYMLRLKVNRAMVNSGMVFEYITR